jgi:hypothetical protein
MSKNKIALTFQQVFLSILFLTLLSGGASLALASQEGISPQRDRIFEIANTTWEICLGAILELSIIASTTQFAAQRQNFSQDTSDDL